MKRSASKLSMGPRKRGSTENKVKEEDVVKTEPPTPPNVAEVTTGQAMTVPQAHRDSLTAWATPLSAPPEPPRTPRKASQKARCLVAHYFQENGPLDSQATDSQAVAQIMALADIQGVRVPGTSPFLASSPEPPFTPDVSQYDLLDDRLVKAVADGRISARWALVHRVEDGTPPAALLEKAPPGQRPESPPLFVNLLPRLQEVSMRVPQADASSDHPAPRPDLPAGPRAACGCAVCLRDAHGPSSGEAGTAATIPFDIAHPAGNSKHPTAALAPEAGAPVPAIASTSQPAVATATASSSQSKGKGVAHEHRPFVIPPRRPIRPAPASAPSAREAFQLQNAERSLVLQIREHQAIRDVALMKMLHEATAAEKAKELERKILQAEVERLELQLRRKK